MALKTVFFRLPPIDLKVLERMRDDLDALVEAVRAGQVEVVNEQSCAEPGGPPTENRYGRYKLDLTLQLPRVLH